MALTLGFCLNLLAKPQASLIPSVSSSNSFAVSHGSLVSSFSAKMKKPKHPIAQIRASAEGLPSELVEDSKFVPLNADEPTYGPPALLLLGFEVKEAEKIRQFLKEMDGEFLEIIYCTEDMIARSLWEAVNTKQPNLEEVKIAKSLPRICFFSGLSGEEMMMFIDAFPETGLEPAVFAALVPNSADKPVAELIDEIMGDHEMLMHPLKVLSSLDTYKFRKALSPKSAPPLAQTKSLSFKSLLPIKGNLPSVEKALQDSWITKEDKTIDTARESGLT